MYARLWSRGNCAGRVHLAWCYSSGKGVDEIDDVKSLKLLTAASEQVDDEWHIVAKWHFGEGLGFSGKIMAEVGKSGEFIFEYLMDSLKYAAGGSSQSAISSARLRGPVRQPVASAYTRKRLSFVLSVFLYMCLSARLYQHSS
jgi:TPR repeat protein